MTIISTVLALDNKKEGHLTSVCAVFIKPGRLMSVNIYECSELCKNPPNMLSRNPTCSLTFRLGLPSSLVLAAAEASVPNTEEAVEAEDLQEEPLTLEAVDSSCSLEDSHKGDFAQGTGCGCTGVDTSPSSLRCMAADHPVPVLVPGPVLGFAVVVVVVAAAAVGVVGVVVTGTGAAVVVDATLVGPGIAEEGVMLNRALRDPALILLQNLRPHHPGKAPTTPYRYTRMSKRGSRHLHSIR